jgi:hypothetical protein
MRLRYLSLVAAIAVLGDFAATTGPSLRAQTQEDGDGHTHRRRAVVRESARVLSRRQDHRIFE